MLYRVGGSSYESVIQSEPEPVLSGQVRVDDVNAHRVRFAQSREECLRLRGKIVTRADVDYVFVI